MAAGRRGCFLLLFQFGAKSFEADKNCKKGFLSLLRMPISPLRPRVQHLEGNSLGMNQSTVAGVPVFRRRLPLCWRLEIRTQPLDEALAEVSRGLRKGGRAVYVVGDSNTKGTYIRNSRIVSAIAQEQGLSLYLDSLENCLQIDDIYRPARGTVDWDPYGRLRREVVVVLHQ